MSNQFNCSGCPQRLGWTIAASSKAPWELCFCKGPENSFLANLSAFANLQQSEYFAEDLNSWTDLKQTLMHCAGMFLKKVWGDGGEAHLH